MQNTFSQSGNDSKWFSNKSFFRICMWHSRPPRDPPPLHGKYHLKFPFWLFDNLPYPFFVQNSWPPSQSSTVWHLTAFIASVSKEAMRKRIQIFVPANFGFIFLRQHEITLLWNTVNKYKLRFKSNPIM